MQPWTHATMQAGFDASKLGPRLIEMHALLLYVGSRGYRDEEDMN
jgi:hypothetical protein